MTTSPRIRLAVDNCFASKRWTEPAEWMRIVRDLGLRYVEASADNECDPLYHGVPALEKWRDKCRRASAETGVKVVNLYSGHGTYATLGLAHTEPEVRDRFLNLWLKPMAKLAGELGAGLGFFCHAFPDSVLQSPERFQHAECDLFRRLAALATYAAECGCNKVGVEQMYTPHQIPWTIVGATKLLREVRREAQRDFYLTIDVGHQCGQWKFRRPERSEWEQRTALWAGRLPVRKQTPFEDVQKEMEHCPWLFASEEDGDPWRWLGELGRYSPIIHLQQCDGKSSPHWPFSADRNALGIIEPENVLRALAHAYRQPPESGMPAPCDEICLTLEIFSGTGEFNRDILAKIKESGAFWRKWIPEDDLTLDKLI